MGNNNSRPQPQGLQQPHYPSTILIPEQGAAPAPAPGGHAWRPGPHAMSLTPGQNVQAYPIPSNSFNRQQQFKTQAYQRTATIRNQVNLRKQSLRLEPVNGSRELLSISFTFDASSPCRVTTFVHAREDSGQNCQISVQGSPDPPVYYPKGLEQCFPPAGPLAAQPQHCINLGRHYLNDLCFYAPSPPAATTRTYPLIIRLEALQEGNSEGKSLEGLQPGCELPQWVQSQSTYAKLVTEEDGSIGIRVLEQKIWVQGESYELQEIYGMDQTVGNTAQTPSLPRQTDGLEDVIEGNECIICMSAPRNTAAIPCRHMSMCHECASALKAQSNQCPLCRKEIDSFLHIKLKPRSQQGVQPLLSEG